MTPRAVAAWSAAGIVVPLVSTAPVPRILDLLVAVAVVTVLAPRHARLRGIATGLAVAAVTAVLLDVLLSHAGDHVLVTLPAGIPAVGGRLTLEAALYGADVALAIAAGSVAAAALAVLVEPHELVDALPAALARTATAAAAALGLLPGLGRSARAIAEAQRLRGVGGRGPRGWPALAVPILVTAMEDSVQLAEAMESRGFGAGPRTRYAPTPWRPADVAVAGAAVLAAAAVIAARVTGVDGDWSPFPTPVWPEFQPVPIAAVLLLATPLLAWRPRRSGD